MKFLGLQRDPKDGKVHVALTSFDGAKLTRISITMGEIAYNLRSALDFTVYELAVIGTGGPVKGTQFPIEDTSAAFQMRVTGRDKKGKQIRNGYFLKGVPPQAITLIRDLQPFAGCAWTRELRELSNPDKHRHLPNLGTHIRPIVLHSEITDPDPDTGHQTINANVQAKVEVFFSNTGTPVYEIHKLIHGEVKATVALLKDLAQRL